MGFGDSFLALATASVGAGYLLQRTLLPDTSFRTACLEAFGVSLLLKAIWAVVIYPFFFNPLRKLPQVGVSKSHS